MIEAPEDNQPATGVAQVENAKQDKGEDQPGVAELPVAGGNLRPVLPDLLAQEIEDCADNDYLCGQPQDFLCSRSDYPSREK